jgi:hypothetical protein
MAARSREGMRAMGGSCMLWPSASKAKNQVPVFSSFSRRPTRLQTNSPSRTRVDLGVLGAASVTTGWAVRLAVARLVVGAASGMVLVGLSFIKPSMTVSAEGVVEAGVGVGVAVVSIGGAGWVLGAVAAGVGGSMDIWAEVVMVERPRKAAANPSCFRRIMRGSFVWWISRIVEFPLGGVKQAVGREIGEEGLGLRGNVRFSRKNIISLGEKGRISRKIINIPKKLMIFDTAVFDGGELVRRDVTEDVGVLRILGLHTGMWRSLCAHRGVGEICKFLGGLGLRKE